MEAIIGVSYAVAAAAALFIIAMNPEGHGHIEHMLAGSILWAKWSNILICVLVFSVVGFLFYIFQSHFRKISYGYQSGNTKGINVVLWDFLFYTFFGIVIIFSVQIAGILLVFSFLIIPATISAIFSSKWGIRVVIAWLVSIVISVIGLAFSYRFDFSIGPSIAAFLGLTLVIVAMIRKFCIIKEIK